VITVGKWKKKEEIVVAGGGVFSSNDSKSISSIIYRLSRVLSAQAHFYSVGWMVFFHKQALVVFVVFARRRGVLVLAFGIEANVGLPATGPTRWLLGFNFLCLSGIMGGAFWVHMGGALQLKVEFCGATYFFFFCSAGTVGFFRRALRICGRRAIK